MKKILILYATAGIGHKKAALAIKKAFDETKPGGVEVSIADALDYTNAFFKRLYLQSYLLMVSKLPLFWGVMYYLTNNFYLNILISRLRRFNNWLNSKKFIEHLINSKFDVVISTHFFASEVISDLKRDGRIKTKLITVVTDYRLHSWWVADFTDIYVVASEDTRKDLIEWKVAPDRIKILGIPAEPIFSKDIDKAEAIKKTGVEGNIFTVLVIGGGFGVGPIEEIVKAIDEVPGPIQIITVCGNNKELVGRMENLKPALRARIKILGFVDNVYEYMAISDIVISKSGGITMTESLVKCLPMIVISPIIGQETRNCDFLIKRGAGIKLNKVSELKGIIKGLITHPERLSKMRSSIKVIRKPYTCYDVAKLAVEG